MEEPSPAKRRKTESINDISTESKINKQWSGSVEISTVSVKPDKLQKLRRIVSVAKMKPSGTDDLIVSSTGSSPSTSPRPENLSALSKPVDPTELFARLTDLVKDENKENYTLKSGDGNLPAGGEDSKRLKSLEDDIKGQSMSDKIVNVSMSTEEFYAVLRKMINDKIKQLEDRYNETIIPNLVKKIAVLESENDYLHDHAKKLQELLTNLAIEQKKKQKQKPDQVHAGIQVSSVEPPPLTPMGSAAQTVALSNKPAPVIHVVDNVSDIHKSPSTAASRAIQVTTLAAPYALRGTALVNGIRHTATASTGHVFTSSAGQPRMYSEAPFKPGSHPNAVVSPRSHTAFARPAAPITATVYPQPQNIPTSPSTMGVRRSSAPTQTPPHRFPYNPPPANNSVMIRTAAQPTVQYVMNQDKSTGQLMSGRQKSPSFQGPPPSYSMASARPQPQQVSYRPGPATNPTQVNGVRHYAVRQGPPSQGGMVGTPVRSPAGPPPLVRAQPNMRAQVNNSPRYQTPHVIRQRPPYPQNTSGNDPRAQATTVSPRNANVPPPPSQSSPPQTNGVVRDLLPPTPTVSISGASSGIVLSWNMTIPEGCAPIDSYQLFAYQNTNQMANTPSLWKKLGIVKALPLPMACTLTQFVSGSMYYFAVRAIDIHGRAGSYSSPCAITLPSESEK